MKFDVNSFSWIEEEKKLTESSGAKWKSYFKEIKLFGYKFRNQMGEVNRV